MNPVEPSQAGALVTTLLDSRLFQEGLIGASFGALFGRLMIHRAERRGGELRPRRVQELNLRWTCIGLSFAILRALLSRLP